MQSLNVGSFKAYKYWHDKAIKEVIAESFFEYSLNYVLTDITKIRNNALKAIIIRHAFEKCGMWPIDVEVCIELMKKYAPDLSCRCCVSPRINWLKWSKNSSI
jgi:hypothetical protein